MRLISQDGKGDMPYENFIFRACGGDIVASRDILTNEKQIVARYSTETKALKVLEMLRNAYAKHNLLKITYQKGLIESMANQLGEDEVIRIASNVFVFPKDEEIEV